METDRYTPRYPARDEVEGLIKETLGDVGQREDRPIWKRSVQVTAEVELNPTRWSVRPWIRWSTPMRSTGAGWLMLDLWLQW